MRKHKRLLKFTTIFLGVIVFCVMCPLSSFGAVGIPINTSDYIYSQADIFDSVYSDVVIDSSPSPIFYSTTMDPTQNIPEFLKNPNVNQFESITTGWHSLGSNPGQVLPTLSSSKYIYNGSHYESDEISFSAPSGHYGLVFVPVFPFSFSEFLSKYDLEDININQSYLSVSFHIGQVLLIFHLIIISYFSLIINSVRLLKMIILI